ncbi:protein yippee-like 2 isoform X1 [Equus quagga]|uniref:protein yippee-like 2 isoform X1 n=1 Tax=Equus quagga TaxID=89248 RepID=UPI001EE21A44|nr:protein yippee-like 2 isoform X1 [Equus quagga]
MRSGGGGSGGDCGFKSAPGAREPAGRCFAAAHPRGAEPSAGRTGQPAAGCCEALAIRDRPPSLPPPCPSPSPLRAAVHCSVHWMFLVSWCCTACPRPLPSPTSSTAHHLVHSAAVGSKCISLLRFLKRRGHQRL